MDKQSQNCTFCAIDNQVVSYDGWTIKLEYRHLRIKKYDDHLKVAIQYCPGCGRYLEH